MTISEKMTLFKREENDERSEWRLKAAFSGVVILVGGVLLTLVIYNINNVKWPDLNMGEGITQQAGSSYSCDVLILGAGMAGISAARTLRQLGVTDFMVVEGSDRVGGRIKKKEFSGLNVEVGANWIRYNNESETNSFDGLVKATDLQFVDDDHQDVTFRYLGNDVTNAAKKDMGRLNAALAKTVSMGNEKIKSSGPDVTYREALSLQGWKSKTDVEKAVEFFGFDSLVFDKPDNQGLKDNFGYFVSDGTPPYFVNDQRGYSSIVETVVDDLNLEYNLFFEEFVYKISYQEKSGETDQKPVQVVALNQKTNKKDTFSADYVIMTFSVGVLKENHIQFTPGLPEEKMKLINMLEMKSFDKIFLKFPNYLKPFWDNSLYILYVDPIVKGRYQTWLNMNAVGGAFKNSNILMVMTQGDDVPQLKKEEVKKELVRILRAMYGSAAVEPEEILVTNWDKDLLSYGAFSIHPKGVSDSATKDICSSFGRMYMAGEMCRGHTGNVYQAYTSGSEVAQEVYNCMHNQTCNT